MRCTTPSGMMANGSPVVVEKSKISPTQRPLASGCLSLRMLPWYSDMTMTSELSRSAATPALGSTPSKDFRT
jgi:hypothetical protein